MTVTFHRRDLFVTLTVTLACFSFTLESHAQNYAHLVRGNQPDSFIVLSEHASGAEVFAGFKFQEYVRKMTGVEIPIYHDDDLQPQGRKMIVSIGTTRFLPGATRKELRIEETLPAGDPVNDLFIVEKADRTLSVVGHTDRGTVLATFALLAKLGCKFSADGEAATVLPGKQATIGIQMFRDIGPPDAALLKQLGWLESAMAAARDVKRPAPRTKSCAFVVRECKPAAVIVISANSATKEIYAANELQKYLKRMTGAEIPIRRDNEPAPEAGQLIVSVGRTLYLTDDLRKELKIGENLSSLDAAHDALAIVKTPGVLYLVGHRDQATAYAVFGWLDSQGCRWFFGNEAGTVIPHGMASIVLKEGRLIKKPDFAIRRVYAWWDYFRDDADRAADDYWHQVNRLSEASPRGYGGHNFDAILDAKLYAMHPEYFSMVNGKRIPPNAEGVSWQMCMTNPDIIRMSAQWAEGRLLLEPGNELVTYFPNDGYGLCECPVCTAIGNPSDVNMYFAKEISQQIFSNHPGLFICVTSYAGASVVPKSLKADGYDQNKDRVMVAIWENSKMTPWLDLIGGYSKASHHLFLNKCWDPITYHAGGTRPVYYKDTLGEYPFYKEHNVVAIELQAVTHWAANGLDCYLASRLMWDANTDINAVTTDFCKKMFPSAPREFAEFLRLYDEKGRYETRAYQAVPAPPADGKGSLTMPQWLSSELACLDKLRKNIRTTDEMTRWRFYALYIHQQALEYAIEIGKGGDEKIDRYIEMMSLLKGMRDMRVVDSNMVIGKGFGGAMRVAGYPGRDLEFTEIPAMKITDEAVVAMFQRDLLQYGVR